MGHEQLRSDRGTKRSQPQGPLYCLNLTCPRYSYDLSLEFSGASVEFKDWAPVLAFIEKSVISLWSKEIKRGISNNHEADWIRKGINEDVVETTSYVEKDCWLKTCEMSTKRRRTQRSDNQYGQHTKESLDLQVEDCNLSHWDDICRQNLNSESVSVEYRESETMRESHGQMDFTGIDDVSLFNCNNDVKDSIGSDLLEPNKRVVNSDILTNGVSSMETEANYASNCRSSSRWEEDPFVEFHDRGSDWSFDFMPENGSARVKSAQTELPLQISSCANHFQTPLDFGKEPQFQIDNFKASRSFSNFHGNGDVDILSQKLDSFQRGQCHSDAENTWPLTKSKIGSHTNEDLDDDHLERSKALLYYGGSFDTEFPLEFSSERGRVHFSWSPTISDQKSEICYPTLKPKDWGDFKNFVQEEGCESRSGVRNSDGSEPFSYDKKQCFCSGFNDRCSSRNFSSASCLDPRSFFRGEYAGVENGMCGCAIHGQNVDETASKRCDSFQGIYSPSTDRKHQDSSVFCNPLISPIRGMDIDLQVCEELGLGNAPVKRSGRTSDISDEFLVDRYDAVVTREAFSPCFDFQQKLSSFEPRVSCFSPLSAGKSPQLALPKRQVINYGSSESGSSLRTRSHSAPPFYRGKKKFLPVMSSLSSTTENSALQTASQACTVSGTQLKHPSRPTLSCRANHQSDEMRSGEDSLFFAEQKVNETSNITQVGAWSHDVTTETVDFRSGYLMKVRDSEILHSKWREGCADAGSKDISNFFTAGDRLNGLKDENEILDIQSIVLDLAGDSLVPKSISRSGLQNAKVLWQIDNKFIPVVACGTLAVIDQHAADERIRLEEMRQKVLSGGMKSIKHLDKEKDLVLPEMAYQLLCNYADHIKHWGWICNIFSDDCGSFAKNLNLLTERASNLTLNAVPCILGVNLSDADLVEYLEQLADTDGSSTIPPSVVRVLNYKACRGAIMFGDKLLPSECSLIVEELKQTSLCFQCAHGRPTTVPLVNLKALHKGILHLRSWHDHSKNAWHGLRKNKVSLDRAKHRLDIARGSG